MRKSVRRNAMYVGFVILLIALLALMGRGGGKWLDTDKKHSQTSTATRYLETKKRRDDAATRKALRIESERVFQEMLERHPELKVTYKDVADEDNGFLQWLNFIDRYHTEGELPLPESIVEMISGRGEWDAAELEKWLDENRELYAEILALGLLPDQSAKGIETSRFGFLSARIPKQSSDLLLAAAKLAISNGDVRTAQLCIQSVLGTSRHLGEIETPSLNIGTVGLVIRMSAKKAVIDLSAVAGDSTSEVLSEWKRLVEEEAIAGDILGRYLFGEVHLGGQDYLIPALLDQQSSREGFPGSLNIKTMLDAYAEYFSGAISKFKGKTIHETAAIYPRVLSIAGIPEEHRAWMDIFPDGMDAWTKSWIHSQRIEGVVDASLAVALGEEIPIEPTSGLPYILDQNAGTISLPLDPRFPDQEKKAVIIPGYGR